MAKTYVYRLIYKYRKHPELLLQYGFQFYTDEKSEEKVFAYHIALKEDNPLFIQCVRFLEHCYNQATTKERETDFKDFQFRLELQEDQSNYWRLILDDNTRAEFSAAQLCVSINSMESDSSYLFINSPMQNSYYNYKTVEECAPEFIKSLLDKRVIFKMAKRYKK